MTAQYIFCDKLGITLQGLKMIAIRDSKPGIPEAYAIEVTYEGDADSYMYYYSSKEYRDKFYNKVRHALEGVQQVD